jgi:tRNA modification GTPase
VTPIPGTTRDSIEVAFAIEGIAFRLIDTAGLRDTNDPVEAIGVSRARQTADAADILLWLGDGPPPLDHPRCIRLHPRCDEPGRIVAPEGSVPCSAVTGEGIAKLLETMHNSAAEIVPPLDAIALNRRQASQLHTAQQALTLVDPNDVVLTAEALRSARASISRLSGHSEVETMLDALFGKFCLGK